MLTCTPLFNVVELVLEGLPKNIPVLCSPTSRKQRLFGDRLYHRPEHDKYIERMINAVNKGVDPIDLRNEILNVTDNKKFIAGCSEISLIAQRCRLECIDTMEIAVNYIMKEL
jgi:hypothetical protein